MPRALIVATLAAVAVAASVPAVEARPDARPGTAVATVRTLSTTLTADATVQSASDSVVIHGRAAEALTRGPSNPSTPSTSSTGSVGGPGGTLTATAGLGSTITTGSRLYAVDGEPVVAVVGNTPSWRTLKIGVEDGPDVRTLERALVKMGFGENITVDKKFTRATAEAVRDWEKAVRRTRPDGVVEPNEIVLIGGDRLVADHVLDVGGAVANDAHVLTLVSTERVITASVPATDLAAWRAAWTKVASTKAPSRQNATVTVHWPEGGTVPGRIAAVGRELTDGRATVTVVPRRMGVQRQAEVELVTRTRPDVLTVPVAAVHDGPGGEPAVTLVANGAATVHPVTLGLVARGRAEVTSGLSPGDVVRLPVS